MVVDDAEDVALHGIIGRDINGLVVSPDHERKGDGGKEAGEGFFMMRLGSRTF